MFGVVIGDIVGSRFEFMATKERDVQFFHGACTFTDDTVCTSAIAAATILALDNLQFHHDMKNKYPVEYEQEQPLTIEDNRFLYRLYSKTLREYVLNYPLAGYGVRFMKWAGDSQADAYGSLGNGCLMRLSDIVLMSESLEQAHHFAYISSNITHNHEKALESVRQYVEIFWFIRMWQGSLGELKDGLKQKFKELNLEFKTVEEYHDMGGFFILAPDTLDRALACLMEASTFDEVIQNVLYIGSDTDTTGAIAGSLAEMMYELSWGELDESLRYFNHKSVHLIKTIAQAYVIGQKQNWGNLAYSHLFNEKKMTWYHYVLELELKDPTAAWDPLELPEDDDYYSEADIRMRNDRQNIILKLLRKIHLIR